MTRIQPMFDPADPRHGTANGYRNLKCRCDECRHAWRDYERTPQAMRRKERYRRVTLGQRPARHGRTHGLRSTYVWGCRCDWCREAERTYRRQYRTNLRGSASGPQGSARNMVK